MVVEVEVVEVEILEVVVVGMSSSRVIDSLDWSHPLVRGEC